MATKASQTHLIRLLTKRNFSAAAAKPAASACTDVKTCTLPNRLVVASADSPIPGLSRVSVAFKAGSRYECPDNFGVSHILRSSAGLSTSRATQFAIIRNLQKLGATVSATSDRETVVYTLESTLDVLPESMKFLHAIVSGQEFRPWELSDNIGRIKLEIASVPAQAILIDLLHKAAYRNTLGNSIFAKEHQVKKINTETLLHFVKENFKSSRASVSGVGIDHDSLVDFANALCLDEVSAGDSAAAKYCGGELRLEANVPHAHVAIGVEASSLQKKDVFTWAVLAAALGGDVSTKYGSGASPLSKAISGMQGVSANAISMPHSDSGLFGIVVSSPANQSHQAVEAVLKGLASGVSDADVKRGKAKVLNEVLSAANCSESLLSEMTYQSLLIGSASSPATLAQSVEQVTADEVKKAQSKLTSSKKSLAAFGNIHNSPYLDQV